MMMMIMMIMVIMMKGFWGMVDQQEYFNPLFVKKMKLIKVSLYMTTYSREGVPKRNLNKI